MLQLVHVIQHFCSKILFLFSLRVHTHFRLQIVGVFACYRSVYGWWSFKTLGSTVVESFFFIFFIHSLVEYVISIFDAEPRVLSNVSIEFLGLKVNYVIGRGLLLINSFLV